MANESNSSTVTILFCDEEIIVLLGVAMIDN